MRIADCESAPRAVASDATEVSPREETRSLPLAVLTQIADFWNHELHELAKSNHAKLIQHRARKQAAYR